MICHNKHMNSFLYLKVKIDVKGPSLQNQYVGTVSHLLFNYCTPITHRWAKHALDTTVFWSAALGLVADRCYDRWIQVGDVWDFSTTFFPMELPLVYTYCESFLPNMVVCV